MSEPSTYDEETIAKLKAENAKLKEALNVIFSYEADPRKRGYTYEVAKQSLKESTDDGKETNRTT